MSVMRNYIAEGFLADYLPQAYQLVWYGAPEISLTSVWLQNPSGDPIKWAYPIATFQTIPQAHLWHRVGTPPLIGASTQQERNRMDRERKARAQEQSNRKAEEQKRKQAQDQAEEEKRKQASAQKKKAQQEKKWRGERRKNEEE